MRVDWCVSSWFRIKNTHSLTRSVRLWGAFNGFEFRVYATKRETRTDHRMSPDPQSTLPLCTHSPGVLRGSGQPPPPRITRNACDFADDAAAAATPRPSTNPPAKRRPFCAAAARPCGPRRRAAVLAITATLATTTAEYLSRVHGRICLKPCVRPTMTGRRGLCHGRRGRRAVT